MSRSPSNVWCLLACCLACLALQSRAATTTTTAPPPGKKEKASGSVLKTQEWGSNLDGALLRASTEYRLTFVLFTKPSCGWCDRLKHEVLPHPEIAELLGHFILVELDVTEEPAIAESLQIRGTPTIVVLAPDGRLRQRINGFAEKADVQRALEEALGVKAGAASRPEVAELVKLLKAPNFPEDRWPDAMEALSSEKGRDDIREVILKMKPFPRAALVKLLEDRRLVARLGATEILEEVTGGDLGFDPWLDDVARNKVALEKWRTWISSPDEKAHQGVVMTPEMVTSYLLDLVSEERERSLRAARKMEKGGPEVLKVLRAFEAGHDGLPLAARNKLRELRYSLMLPTVAGLDAATLSHRLVFGNTDMRMKSLRDIVPLQRKAVPVIRDFLDDREPIVRETAVDALVAAGGRAVVPHLETHLKEEKDANVVYSILRGIGSLPSKRGLKLLCSYLQNTDEDLVIVSIQGIANLKSKSAADDIGKCLDDSRWRVRVAALDAIGKLQLQSLAPQVEKALNDPDEFVRTAAVHALKGMASVDLPKRLETIFLKEDAMKAPVMELLRGNNQAIPESFLKAVDGTDSDILIGVIEKIGKADGSSFPMLSKLAQHPNGDVSAAALRLIAQTGMGDPRCRKLGIEALRGADRVKALAFLTAVEMEDDLIKRYNPEARRVDLGPEKKDGAADPSAKKGEELFDAFSTEAPRAPAKGKKMESSGDLFSAFDAKGDVPSDPPALIEEVRGLLARKDDPEITKAAALVLMKWGYLDGVSLLIQALPKLTSEERVEIARGMERTRRWPAIPLFQAFLKDAAADVRSQVVDALLNDGADSQCLDLVFSEMAREGSPLLPSEVYGYRLQRLAGATSSRAIVHKWALEMLQRASHPTLQTLGLILLEKSWVDGDDSLVAKFLESGVPWQRRAALHALGTRAPDRFAARLDSVVEDPSEQVRLVLPAIYSASENHWVHYFDENSMEDEYISRTYHGGAGRPRPEPLAEPVRAALKKLTADKFPVVRFESFFCLVSRFEPVNLADFTAAIESLPEQETARYKVRSYIEENYQQLGENFSALLPYLGKDVDEKKLAEIYAHFGVKPEDEDALATEPAASAIATYKTPSMAKPASDTKRPPLKVVLFSKAGAADGARRLLTQMAESFPGLVIEEHDLHLTASIRYNEALCGRFNVPEKSRLVAPSLFCGGGYLIKDDISADRLGSMLVRAGDVPLEKWYTVPDAELASANSAVARRFSSVSPAAILRAALERGVPPGMIAAVILFFCLQVARRTPREIRRWGVACLMGVLVACCLVGLGFLDAPVRPAVPRLLDAWLNRIMAIFALIVMAFNLRDGIRCWRGNTTGMALVLPGILMNSVNRGMKPMRGAVLFLALGAVISLLALAGPGRADVVAISFMLRSGTASGVFQFLLFTVAFLTPPCIVFILAFCAMRSAAPLAFLRQRPLLFRFAAAAVFLILSMVLLSYGLVSD